MLPKRSLISTIFLGFLILIFGLTMIFAKDWVWLFFLYLYSFLGIQAEPSRFWGMFINTIGFTICAIGLFLIWKSLQNWRRSR